MNKLIKKLKKPLKNKRGFTFVELIAVVAMMGVLAVVVGGLVGSGTAAYVRQKQKASAKDLSNIIEKEVARLVLPSDNVILLNGDIQAINGKVYSYNALDELEEHDENYEGENCNFAASNPPYNSFANNQYGTFFSSNNVLMYGAAATGDKTGHLVPSEYFSDNVKEQDAIYGDFIIKMYFKPLFETTGAGTSLCKSLYVFVDVYDESDTEYKSAIYESQGRRILLLSAQLSNKNTVHSYCNVIDEDHLSSEIVSNYTKVGKKIECTYVDNPDFFTSYTHIYFGTK